MIHLSTKVYRLENIFETDERGNHEGPYTSFYTDSWEDEEMYDTMKQKHNNNSTHPNLFEDFNPRNLDIYDLNGSQWNTQDYYCACPTLGHLVEWFGEFLPMLLRNGFSVVEYDVVFAVEGHSKRQSFIKIDDYNVNKRTEIDDEKVLKKFAKYLVV